MTRHVILASASPVRARLLRDAGVVIDVVPGRVDEEAVSAALLAEGHKPRDVADGLAELKAQKIAQRHPGAFVIGADQVQDFEGQVLHKAETLEAGRARLGDLRGKQHQLHTAAVVFEDGAPVFRFVDTARLTMRPCSDDFLDRYVAENQEAVLTSAGGYWLESAGIQLFSRIDGNYFTILGLPMLPLLDYLRTRGVLET